MPAPPVMPYPNLHGLLPKKSNLTYPKVLAAVNLHSAMPGNLLLRVGGKERIAGLYFAQLKPWVPIVATASSVFTLLISTTPVALSEHGILSTKLMLMAYETTK